ncbi:MAG TPA: N-6 DNA methylase [Anaerolineae bacterium]|nr:N-6 DNA methylase [Anaerolineae bacterium]HQM14937.1 N-6 DNA methylase [Anaerolineae bacterium]
MKSKSHYTTYLKALAETQQRGDAREESFYPALAALLEEAARAAGKTDVHVTTLPKATDAGNPDFRLWNGSDRIIGYVEAKKPTEEHLDRVEESEQLRRYRDTFPNLILTNFLEFRLYRNGECSATALLGRPAMLTRLHTAPPAEKPEALTALLEQFLDFALPATFTAESLAVELARHTHFLRDVTAQQLTAERERPGFLTGFYEAFKQFLIGSLTPEDFADLYAQTVTYGLFAARIRTDGVFNRRVAFHSIPHTIGVLRDLFRFISLGDLPEPLAWCVDDIAEVLAVADAPGILDRYYHEGKGSDPIVHFYETFLAQYDPAERERRGVYYTPEPVVSYIVRSLHGLLQTEFGKVEGLAAPDVTLLDPAAGTMTFVARAAQQAVSEFTARYGHGAQATFIREHILKHFYAFELMMAPYAVGHLKMAFFLEELGYRLTDEERMPFYLTNTLDDLELEQSRLPGFAALAEESRLAAEVKKQTPVLVILGNPPYSGHSSNTGAWITGLIDDYKQVDGQPLGEKNPKWLQDDYVKFLRFAQWKIEQAGRGVVGMITNHGYLDNPTFRGMRQSLLHTFDALYVLDLHGNALKRETTPEGGKDENVFDIRQGVAIAFFIKNGRGKGEAVSRLYHADVWGARADKYAWLDAHTLADTPWTELTPQTPFYLFTPHDAALEADYRRFPGVPELFPVNSVGIVTARDGFVFDFDLEALKRRIRTLRDSDMPDELAAQAYGLRDKPTWTLRATRAALRADAAWEEKFTRCLYRPFDERWLYYHTALIERHRGEVMRHMLAGENLALITSRMTKGETFKHAQVTTHITEVICMSPKTSNNGFVFPLYLYPDPEAAPATLFAALEPAGRRPNLHPALLPTLAATYGRTPSPEEVFAYVYAILYTPTYRARYAEFLRMDFPRIPFTRESTVFAAFAGLGERLIALHLLRSPELEPPTCRFEGAGDSSIARGRKDGLRYDPAAARVYINSTQVFAPVPLDVWTYQVGGYQVCEKWLKDRQERRLTLDDIRTYCRIVTALGKTIAVQQELDGWYAQLGESLELLPKG